MCGGSILSCCPHHPHGHKWALKEDVVVSNAERWNTLLALARKKMLVIVVVGALFVLKKT